MINYRNPFKIIKEELKSQKKSMKWLAESLNIPYRTVMGFANGKDLKVLTWLKLSNFLNLDLNIFKNCFQNEYVELPVKRLDEGTKVILKNGQDTKGIIQNTGETVKNNYYYWVLTELGKFQVYYYDFFLLADIESDKSPFELIEYKLLEVGKTKEWLCNILDMKIDTFQNYKSKSRYSTRFLIICFSILNLDLNIVKNLNTDEK